MPLSTCTLHLHAACTAPVGTGHVTDPSKATQSAQCTAPSRARCPGGRNPGITTLLGVYVHHRGKRTPGAMRHKDRGLVPQPRKELQNLDRAPHVLDYAAPGLASRRRRGTSHAA